MKIKLPKRFYTPEQLAERWECKVEDITHLIETGGLRTADKLAARYGKSQVKLIKYRPDEDGRYPPDCAPADSPEYWVLLFAPRKPYRWKLTLTRFGLQKRLHIPNIDRDLPKREAARIWARTETKEWEELRKQGAFTRVILAAEVSRFEREHGEPTEDTAPPPSWPWGDYETPLLRILAEAANHFCLDGPNRYPKKDCGAVVNWIKARMEANGMPASDQLAGAMETLIAPRPYVHHRQRKQGKP